MGVRKGGGRGRNVHSMARRGARAGKTRGLLKIIGESPFPVEIMSDGATKREGQVQEQV